MKVLCIDENAWPKNLPLEDPGGVIKNGSFYEVTNIHYLDGYVWFSISEDNPNFCYWENCFAPTSDIDEKEFERNYNKELV